MELAAYVSKSEPGVDPGRGLKLDHHGRPIGNADQRGRRLDAKRQFERLFRELVSKFGLWPGAKVSGQVGPRVNLSDPATGHAADPEVFPSSRCRSPRLVHEPPARETPGT